MAEEFLEAAVALSTNCVRLFGTLYRVLLAALQLSFGNLFIDL